MSELALITELPDLPFRPRDGHKGTFGRVLVVAGSRGMSGAAVLCASAALRGGAGLVFLAVPESILPIVATANPCYLTVPLPEDGSGKIGRGAETILLEQARAAQSLVIGPGLGQSDDLRAVVEGVITRTETPALVDADALNLVGPNPKILTGRKGPVVITPHPGEFARLTGTDTASVQSARQERAAAFAREHGVIVVLKGVGTIVTDGRAVYVNTTGNPGMATGGTGDVLAGLIGALLGRGLEAFPAAQLGVYLHGLAGDLVAEELGEESLIASDVVDYLPWAFQQHQGERGT